MQYPLFLLTRNYPHTHSEIPSIFRLLVHRVVLENQLESAFVYILLRKELLQLEARRDIAT